MPDELPDAVRKQVAAKRWTSSAFVQRIIHIRTANTQICGSQRSHFAVFAALKLFNRRDYLIIIVFDIRVPSQK